MKPIVVEKQVRLGPGRIMSLTVAGMIYRLFRSSVTVVILTLAVTFLAHVLSYSLIEHRTQVNAYEQLRDARLLGGWVNRLSEPAPADVIVANLAAGDPSRLTEYGNWLNGEDLPVETARDLVQVQRYLDGLPESKRITVTAGLETGPFIERMTTTATVEDFLERLERNRLRMPLGGADRVRDLMLQRVPAMNRVIEKIQARHREAIDEVAAAMGGRAPQVWMAEMPDTSLAVLKDAGFAIEPEHLDRLKVEATKAQKLATFTLAIDNEAVETALMRRLDVERSEIAAPRVLEYARSSGRAKWLAGLMAEHTPDHALPAESVQQLSSDYRREQKLMAAVGDTVPQASTGVLDLPDATRWLVLLSFLVCAVGVTNAMFMSVTERFTEIATMKCLGALDGSLMMMFLFESGIQGLVGAVFGIVLGIGLSALRGLLTFGLLSFEAFPLTQMLLASVLAMVAGMVLAVVAAVGPAWMAARLVPMEAMRID